MSGPEVRLTGEQMTAVCSPAQHVYVEAAPGPGKTTVAAERFGLLRFTGAVRGPVTAVSFTRSASAELRRRILLRWGSGALRWPHRVLTFDALLQELLAYLLKLDLLRWPGGHTELTVHDSWKGHAEHTWGRWRPVLDLDGRDVVVRTRGAPTGSHVKVNEFAERVADGECTHDDIRDVLSASFLRPEILAAAAHRLAESVGALIVDEVFDANRLDLDVVRLVCQQDIRVTVIGDPWQALYDFRGARPRLVPDLIDRHGFAHLPLTRSYRFCTAEAAGRSTGLRAGRPVTLPSGGSTRPDVVLAATWKQLWDCDATVLPLSFSPPGSTNEAAVLLLLDRLTTMALGQRTIFLADAMASLEIGDETVRRLAEPLSQVLELLRKPAAVDTAYEELIKVVGRESTKDFKRKHQTHIRKLEQIRDRLIADGSSFIPGLTIHQAKGREWDDVGVRLTATEIAALRDGLRVREEAHRKLYVALTRARRTTITV